MVESFGLQRTVGYQEFRLFDIRKISTFVENQQIFFYSPISKEYKFRLLKIRDKSAYFLYPTVYGTLWPNRQNYSKMTEFFKISNFTAFLWPNHVLLAFLTEIRAIFDHFDFLLGFYTRT